MEPQINLPGSSRTAARAAALAMGAKTASLLVLIAAAAWGVHLMSDGAASEEPKAAPKAAPPAAPPPKSAPGDKEKDGGGPALPSSPAKSAAPAAQAAGAPATLSKTATVHFTTDVMPLLSRFGCNVVACHGSANGKGGLRLSMFGAYAEDDYAAIAKAAAGRWINLVEPAKSLLILKVTESVPHKGGKKVQPGSPEHDLLVSWVAQGASWTDEKAPRLVSVKIQPETLSLGKGESRQMSAKAVYADNTEKDITRDAVYKSGDPRVAAFAAVGKVSAADFGATPIIVSYLRRSAVGRIVVPRPLSAPFPEPPADSKIDQLVWAKLKELGVPPSGLCMDQEFIRRVYMDVIGLLPTPDEVQAFLADNDSKKRAKLIDRLLAREEFADFWTLKWGDLLRIKSESPSNLGPNAVQAYHDWVRESIARNKPYNQFVTELLTSTGSNFRSPPANYFRAFPKRDPQNLAEATALVFMGARIGCARCHAHPQEDWTIDDNLGMAAFFSKVQFKDTQEWKEEIVYTSPDPVLRHPRTRQPIAPKFLGGETPEIAKDEDPRSKFAEWLTSPKNPWFARNIANRIWFWLLGRGIVHEPDDFRPTNPPTNPELLAYLESELVTHQFDLKHVFRLILNSRTYQLSSKMEQGNPGTPPAAPPAAGQTPAARQTPPAPQKTEPSPAPPAVPPKTPEPPKK